MMLSNVVYWCFFFVQNVVLNSNFGRSILALPARLDLVHNKKKLDFGHKVKNMV